MSAGILSAIINELPDLGIPYLTEIGDLLQEASPLILMIIGGILYLFADAIKGIIKLIGAGLFIYGLLSFL